MSYTLGYNRTEPVSLFTLVNPAMPLGGFVDAESAGANQGTSINLHLPPGQSRSSQPRPLDQRPAA